mmetsp:Transcript_8765/g.8674  ORF Transcript_8765/g.8674 Transcript_8765/m.8674 type:complete len:93 (+) Transcript_8765:67-345(+)
MLQGAIDLILVPGSSLKLVPVINLAVLCLLVVLLCLTYSKIATIHLVVMSFLAFGLLASVNWFVFEFNRIKNSESEGVVNADGNQVNMNKTD